jgi:hypothetical protein
MASPAFLRALTLICICASVVFTAPQSPSSYPAYTGVDPKPIPPPPTPGPANSVFIDPTFGTRILRVTDEKTKFDDQWNVPASFISTDAGFHRAWNANSTAIKLTGAHGDGYWMNFDPVAFKVGSLHPVSFGSRWEWSAVDSDIIYYLHGNWIAKYNKSTGRTTDLRSSSTSGKPEPVGYKPVVVGADNWVCSAAGRGQQGSYTKIYCINPADLTSRLIDVQKKTVDGIPQSDPNWPTSAAGVTLGVHAMAGGSGASWLSVTFHRHSWGGNGDAVFNLDTNRWSLVKDPDHGGDIYWAGHHVLGNGKFASSVGSQSGEDGRGIVLRNADNIMLASDHRFVMQPPPPEKWCDADHLSWANSASNANAPILSSRYGGSRCGDDYTWEGEIVAATVDGSNTVWRFVHNHNMGSRCYYGQAFAQISNDGKWALFSSPWGGTLGAHRGFDCPTRIDTFVVRLLPSSMPTSQAR